MLGNQFGCTRWNSMMTCVLWNLASVHLETLLVRCNIGAQFAPTAPKSKKPFWTHLLVLLGEGAEVDARFCLFGDSANLDAR